MLTLALMLMTAPLQDPPAPPAGPPLGPMPATAQQAGVDARAAADAAAGQEDQARYAMCVEAREARRRIAAAAVRLGERDADLMRAWAAADRIGRLACSVAPQADRIDAPDL
jgi:hypothetical protein